MKQFFILIISLAIQSSALQAENCTFSREKDVAQYKGSDYANVVHVEREFLLHEPLRLLKIIQILITLFI